MAPAQRGKTPVPVVVSHGSLRELSIALARQASRRRTGRNTAELRLIQYLDTKYRDRGHGRWRWS